MKDLIFARAASSGVMLPVGFAQVGTINNKFFRWLCNGDLCDCGREMCGVGGFRCLLIELLFGDAGSEDILQGVHLFFKGDYCRIN